MATCCAKMCVYCASACLLCLARPFRQSSVLFSSPRADKMRICRVTVGLLLEPVVEHDEKLRRDAGLTHIKLLTKFFNNRCPDLSRFDSNLIRPSDYTFFSLSLYDRFNTFDCRAASIRSLTFLNNSHSLQLKNDPKSETGDLQFCVTLYFPVVNNRKQLPRRFEGFKGDLFRSKQANIN